MLYYTIPLLTRLQSLPFCSRSPAVFGNHCVSLIKRRSIEASHIVSHNSCIDWVEQQIDEVTNHLGDVRGMDILNSNEN